MQQWDYLKKTAYRQWDKKTYGWTEWQDLPDLRELGKQGWELVGLCPVSDGLVDWNAGTTHEIIYVFKRPSQGSA